MSETNIKAEREQAINKPIPVESAFNDDLEVRLEGLKQMSNARQIIRGLQLKVD